MKIAINYREEIETNIREDIEFVRDEFECLFGQKNKYTLQDKNIAIGLLNHLSKLIETPICLDFLSRTLEDLELNYPTLF
ncbi:hypothetical protein NEF87_000410 [Candidatus Lokiarchaeum ossiferum]|uniref:Uncharacterized protein n=1 Tax=Candidatus Lokiarchaeum ossiferum TaxID=2951803 RepID=A0ABY6HKS2_9ARCH|nr:hypothetical protein NEF87_000410 [Candidatus Lokiarchaeum sp. B-35]